MPFDTTARSVAEYLKGMDFAEIYAHNDADGIAAASILCQALFRAGCRFRVRIVADLTTEDLRSCPHPVLCDLGASLADLPDDVVVIDHHVPRFSGDHHVNPRLFGVSGERELSAAGAAYLVAQAMGENRDLAGIALLGIIGDRQEFSGKNREILNDGIATGIISPWKGLLLPGQDHVERFACAANPYLDGVSGNEALCRSLVEECTIDGEIDNETLLSRIILEVGTRATTRAIEGMYGNGFLLERESVREAHTLAAMVEACGKAGWGGLAVSLCLRQGEIREEAWSITREFRMSVIHAVQTAQKMEEHLAWYRVQDARVVGTVADIIARDLMGDQPVAVIGEENGRYRISLRCPEGVVVNLEAVAAELASRCGGIGGGHETRAGATIEAQNIDCFMKELRKAIAS
ncbi:MAG: DHH family phosphoesterase [Methanomicrobiales archaeon]|nr:DHH family phosphoesterase [Methanomicrobiales archaeon]